MINENHQYKDKDFAQRADDKEDPRKEEQGSTINTSAMSHNKTRNIGAGSFPQDMSRHGHGFNAERSQSSLQSSKPHVPPGLSSEPSRQNTNGPSGAIIRENNLTNYFEIHSQGPSEHQEDTQQQAGTLRSHGEIQFNRRKRQGLGEFDGKAAE